MKGFRQKGTFQGTKTFNGKELIQVQESKKTQITLIVQLNCQDFYFHFPLSFWPEVNAEEHSILRVSSLCPPITGRAAFHAQALDKLAFRNKNALASWAEIRSALFPLQSDTGKNSLGIHQFRSNTSHALSFSSTQEQLLLTTGDFSTHCSVAPKIQASKICTSLAKDDAERDQTGIVHAQHTGNKRNLSITALSLTKSHCRQELRSWR